TASVTPHRCRAGTARATSRTSPRRAPPVRPGRARARSLRFARRLSRSASALPCAPAGPGRVAGRRPLRRGRARRTRDGALQAWFPLLPRASVAPPVEAEDALVGLPLEPLAVVPEAPLA